MPTKINAKATLHQRAVHEFREFVILTVYLYITLGAVIMMKTAVLHAEGIEGTSKNAPVNDGLAMDADVLWFRRGFVGAGSTFLAS